MNFPLVAGKTWKASDSWKNRNGNTGWDNITYHVIGSETISVPAGDFEAIKVVGEGWWNNHASKNSGKIEIQFWYSPAVKTIVKYERKDYFRNEVDLNSSTDLTAASVSDGSVVAEYGKDLFPGTAKMLGRPIQSSAKDGSRVGVGAVLPK